jgi:hypothetical protein
MNFMRGVRPYRIALIPKMLDLCAVFECANASEDEMMIHSISRGSLVLVLLFAAISIQAATHSDAPLWETRLIPVYVQNVQGAHGSLWHTELWIHNGLDRPLSFETDVLQVNVFCVGPVCPQPDPIPPGESRRILLDTFGRPRPHRLLHVRREIADDVTFSLRILDRSRLLESWGAGIPTPAEEQWVSGTVRLLDIPMTSGYRQSLRIYTRLREDHHCESLTIRLFDLESGETLGTTRATLLDGFDNCVSSFFVPNSAEFHSLSSLVASGIDVERIGIELVPDDPTLAYWAFVSVTNDATQHVTVIAP